MTFEHVLAVVPVADVAVSGPWYDKLFGRPCDNAPMPSLVEWQVVPGGWVQVWQAEGDAVGAPGHGLLNLAVDDLPAAVAAAAAAGLVPGPVLEAAAGVRLCTLSDPDGNTIRLIGHFRVVY